MPYFFILPAYCLALAVALLVGVVCVCTPRRRAFGIDCLGASAGSLLGMLANLPLFFLTFALFEIPDSEIPAVKYTLWLLIGAVVFVGPFVASAAGVWFGGRFGIRWARRRRRRSEVPDGAQSTSSYSQRT